MSIATTLMGEHSHVDTTINSDSGHAHFATDNRVRAARTASSGQPDSSSLPLASVSLPSLSSDNSVGSLEGGGIGESQVAHPISQGALEVAAESGDVGLHPEAIDLQPWYSDFALDSFCSYYNVRIHHEFYSISV